jgi:signal transduction histidine kinase
MQRTSVGDVLREACETVEPAVQAKHITLRVSVDPGLPPIDADPDRLRQVFWNVLSNAVKFTPTEGTIAAAAARDGDTIRVDVTDTGVGIAPDFLPFVFDRFRQGDSSDTRPYQGLGLGLAIVRHLVEAHGGTASAASEGRDRGTRITIHLPISNSQ